MPCPCGELIRSDGLNLFAGICKNPHIDDVDHILFGQCCLAERLPQERFAVIVERFNFEKLAHGR